MQAPILFDCMKELNRFGVKFAENALKGLFWSEISHRTRL